MSAVRLHHILRAGAVASLALAFGIQCTGETAVTEVAPSVATEAPLTSGGTQPPEPIAEVAEEELCGEIVPIWREGERVGEVCELAAAREGLTVLDLSNAWAPRIFEEDPSLGRAGRQPFRSSYVALADERERTSDGQEVDFERYLELYGIFPNFRVLSERLGEHERFACHQEVDGESLAYFNAPVRPSSDAARAAAQVGKASYARSLGLRLKREAERRGLESIEELGTDRRYAPLLRQYQNVRGPGESIWIVQEHLVCDGLLASRGFRRGVFDAPTAAALRQWQRMHMIISYGMIDRATVEAMYVDHRDLVYRQVLRALRERMVDAAGLIEDGSALGEYGTVFGRHLDPPDLRVLAERGPLEGGAPDYISPATEAAASALGWTGPDEVEAFIEGLSEGGLEDLRVAVALPPAPPWHSAHMDLQSTIDRGDIWYDFSNRRPSEPSPARPTQVLSVTHEGKSIPLVRWSTTIGGWQAEVLGDGRVGMKYKESPPGRRMWRDLIASPAWIPPESTPDRELIRRSGPEGLRANQRALGPGYASAYGLVMLIHHYRRVRSGVELELGDEGVRSHGSASYPSILRGYSHGCHRLFNHLAVRLGDYLLRHREHVRHGPVPAGYERVVRSGNASFSLRLTSRGYRYELTPPVPVIVLRGNVRSERQSAPTEALPLPRHRGGAAALAEAAAESSGSGGAAGGASATGAPPVRPAPTPATGAPVRPAPTPATGAPVRPAPTPATGAPVRPAPGTF